VTSKSKKHTRDDKEQSNLFIKKARVIGADEEHSHADELIGHLAKKPELRELRELRSYGDSALNCLAARPAVELR